MKSSRTTRKILVSSLALIAITGCGAQETTAAPTETVTVSVTPSAPTPSSSTASTPDSEEDATVPVSAPTPEATEGEQTSQPSESASWPNDHAPNPSDLYIPNPSPTPLGGVPAMSIDMSLVQAEGAEDGNFVMYLKVSRSQGASPEAAAALGDARAESLAGTPYAQQLSNVVVYSLDREPLYQTPITSGARQ